MMKRYPWKTCSHPANLSPRAGYEELEVFSLRTRNLTSRCLSCLLVVKTLPHQTTVDNEPYSKCVCLKRQHDGSVTQCWKTGTFFLTDIRMPSREEKEKIVAELKQNSKPFAMLWKFYGPPSIICNEKLRMSMALPRKQRRPHRNYW